MPEPLRLTRAQTRAVRILSQGLHETSKANPAQLVERTGFVRTLGGCDAYLAVRARQRTLRRRQLDEAVDRSLLQVSPAARGCMYLVARSDVPLCLRVAEQLSAARDERDRTKAGIKNGEVEDLAEQVHRVLERSGPSTTDGLRKAMPTGSIRSLGERGKKVGVSSPLPAALRQLEFRGLVERTPEGGRVDTERYLWRAARRSPFAGARLPEEPARLHALLLERFLQHAGVATLQDFCGWAGLPQRDAKAALVHARNIPAHVDGTGEALAAPALPAMLRSLDTADEAVALLPFEDNLTHLGGGPALLVDDEHHDLEVPVWGGAGPTRLGDVEHMSFRTVLADGRIVGFWEFDPDAQRVAVHCFAAVSRQGRQQLEELAAATAAFLRDEIGNGHAYSLDTDAELRKRLALLSAIDRRGRKAPRVRARR